MSGYHSKSRAWVFGGFGRRLPITAGAAIAVLLLASCSSVLLDQEKLIEKARQDPNSLLIVDCALPPRVVSQGLAMTYLASGGAVKTTAIDCGIRGGKYVSYDRANYQTALQVWLDKAKAGDAEAETNVGEIYEKGLGLPSDPTTAAQWYEKAAAKGYSRAQINLGYLYEKGLGVPKDLTKALNWYRKASGFASEDLVFASSIEVGGQAQMAQAKAEIESLKGELAGSRREIAALQQRLGTSQSQLEESREQLRQTLDSLEQTRSQREKAKSAPPGEKPLNLPRLDQELRDKEAQARAQSEALKRLQEQYQEENQALLDKLSKAEKRASELDLQLDKNKFETARLETKLAESEATLEKLKLDYQAREQSLGVAPAQDEAARKALQVQLAQRESDLEAQRARIDSLEKKMAEVSREKQALEKKAAAGSRQPDQSKALAARLAQREAELNAQKDRVATLEQEMAKVSREKQAIEQQSATGSQQRDRSKELETQLAKREAELKAEQARIVALEQEMAKVGQEKQKLEKQSASGAQVRDKSLEAVAAQLTDTMNQLKEARSGAQGLEQDKDRLAAELKGRSSALAKKDAQLKALEKQMADYSKEVSRLKGELKTVKSAQPAAPATPAPALTTAAANGGPKIELIDPPLTLTRGLPTVKLRSLVASRPITGSVHAAAGIASFIVNDQAEKVDDTGLFKAEIKLAKKETPVNITLIDKRANKASLDFIIISGDQPAAPQEKPAEPTGLPSDLNFGKYYALVIGNSKYAHTDLPTLDTPASDAQAIAKILKEHYGFDTTLLTNATRYDILTAMNKYRDKLTEKDNLLIYYAGHGELDKVNQRGQWLPVDAERNNTANWISTDAITDILNSISAKHILVIADSCYSGAMTRAALAQLAPNVSQEIKVKWYKKMLENKSRTVLTSGGLEPVLDTGAGGHSIFAKVLIEALSANAEILSGQNLFRNVGDKVKRAAERYGYEQSPQYAPIRYTDHEASDFFFVPTTLL